jgi:hypothetical protein
LGKVEKRMQVDLRKYRNSDSDSIWALPRWQYPDTIGVFPLLAILEDRAIPIGTAFLAGSAIPFVITAAHNLECAAKLEPRLERLISRGPLEGSQSFGDVGLSILHSSVGIDKLHLTLLPMEKFFGSPPTDISIGSPQFDPRIKPPGTPLSFVFPRVGERILSVGYRFLAYPCEGISMSAIMNGSFDWDNDYQAELLVAEGTVREIFAGDFANGYVRGPCFSFDYEIEHGMSGGPIFNSAGHVCGVNSAAATSFFQGPTSIGSALYMSILTEVEFGMQIGPIRIDRRASILALIDQGLILTDGSETNIGFSTDEASGKTRIHGAIRTEDRSSVHNNFRGLQSNEPLYVVPEGAPIKRLKKLEHSRSS